MSPEEKVTTSNGQVVHYSVDNNTNEVEITGVEVKSDDSGELLKAVEAVESVGETMEGLGYWVNGLS
jgi:hypothetical protein